MLTESQREFDDFESLGPEAEDYAAIWTLLMRW